MPYSFHEPAPHMDDLLNLDCEKFALALAAHKLPKGFTGEVLTLLYTSGSGREYWRYPDNGHIYAVADILRHIFKQHQSQLMEAHCKKMESTYLAPKNFDAIPRLLYTSLLESNRQMHLLLIDVYDETPDGAFWPDDYDGRSPTVPWATLTLEDEWQLIDAATREWALTYDKVIQHLFKMEDSTRVIGTTEYASRMLYILNTFFEVTATTDPMRNLNAAFDFFPEFTTFISDMTDVINDETSHDLIDLGLLPSRHEILKAISDHAPTKHELGTAILNTIFELDKPQRECSICLKAWTHDATDEILEILEISQQDKWYRGGRWLTLSSDWESLEIEAGYEIVPLKMACGHVFCAGCIKTWLDSSEERLQCPFRDAEYGLQRHEAVIETDKLRMEYYKKCIREVKD